MGNGKESHFEVVRVCSFASYDGVRKSGLPSTKKKTLVKLDT